MNIQRKLLNQILAATAAAAPMAIALIATPVSAQVTSDAAQNPTMSAVPNGDATSSEDAGSIVVTGSRIARTDLQSAAPLTVTTAQEFALKGSPNVETVINQLPQVIPGSTAFSNNPGGGVSTLNLRGLGETRTLVLVNGRRYMFYDTSQVVDLNTIPTFLIDNVDTVTGGASAVYGSDAIAGVVNFRLRNNLKGLEVGAQYGLTSRGDGRRYDIHTALGGEFADGRGHVTVYGEYYKRAPIFAAARSFSQTTLTDDGEGGFTTGGSSTNGNGRFYTSSTFGAGTNYVNASTTRGGATFDASGAASRTFITPPNSPNDFYNYAPTNYLMVPQERWLLGGYGDYEINDHMTAYTEVTYVNNRVDNALAPTPVTGTFVYDIAALSNYLSTADQAALATISARQVAAGTIDATTGAPITAGRVSLTTQRRVTETGLRESLDERNAFRVLAGLKGDITEKLHYDAYYSFARTRNANIQQGNISRSAFQAGLLDGSLNIFGPNTISGDALSAITILAQNQDISQLQVATGAINGELFELGMGAAPVAFAAGVEYRSVSSRFVPDTALSSGDVIGFNAVDATQGGYHVTEGFGELSIPIIADKPFFKLLELHGAARYSDYNLAGVGNVWTYAGDAKWSPVQDITFRGQYQRAVRAPNVGELFGGQSQGFPQAVDPCATAAAATAGALRDTCIATGVPASQVGNASLQTNPQIQGLFGGNPDLSAEKSTSYTFGAVLSPRFLPRFHISADYFNIKVTDAIATLGGGVSSVLNICYNIVQNVSSPYCQAVARNPASGEIDGSIGADGTQYVVSVLNANIASYKTSGIDIAADYTQPLGFGVLGSSSKLIAAFNGTWTDKTVLNFGPGTTPVDCAGKFGTTCGEPQSSYKWTTRLSYVDGGLTLSGLWRHLGAVKDDDPATDYTVERIKAFNYFDVAISYDITDQYRLTVGVNNLADKKPPLLGDNQQQTNTYPNVYDVLGRDFFVSANFRF